MAASGFGRKGASAGASAIPQRAAFGAARPSEQPQPVMSAADGEMERRRQAFLAAERARSDAPHPGGTLAGELTHSAPPTVRTVFVREKSMMVAYALWFFACQLGAHRFYLGRTGSAAGMVCLWLGSLAVIVTSGFNIASMGIGLIALLASFIWMIVDAFLIPGMVRDANGPRPETVAYAFA